MTMMKPSPIAGALICVLSLTVCVENSAAADLSSRPPVATLTVAPVAANGRFYVRGDVGIGRNTLGKFSQPELLANGGAFISRSIGDTVYIGAGLGWQINSRFRMDITGEYRASAQIKAMDNLNVQLLAPAGALQANTIYQGNLTSYVGLLNGYWDMFSLRGFTVYAGAGIGVAHNTMSGFTTASSATFTDAATGAQTVQLNNGHAGNRSKSNLAWALMAGTSYDLSPNAKLDMGYRYLNLGAGTSATTGVNGGDKMCQMAG